MASGTRARGIVPGTPIVAADVNANFSALADALAERQLRVDGECPSGSAIRVIDADGGVTCQAVTGEGETLGGVESVSARTPTRTAVSTQQAAWSWKPGRRCLRVSLAVRLSWRRAPKGTAPRGEDDHRDVFMYVVCFATL